ncbi:MAG: putative sulfate exporter family transporter [Candidatus Rokubacteria bacterium]|nr:putative sulfate exporter family transporter [Candidatus Rokubacteria bacterium]
MATTAPSAAARPTPAAPPAEWPGWLLMVTVAAAGYLVADLVAPWIAIGGRSPLEAATVTILLGIAIRSAGHVPRVAELGIKNYEAALKIGIVLLGLSLSFLEMVRLGAQAIGLVILCLLIAPVTIYLTARAFGIAPKLGILLGIGTTICGSTAIAIAAPVIEAKDEEFSYAISTISLFGILAMLALPMLAGAMAMGDTQYGIWAGLAVPSTPQVLGAAYMYSAAAGAQATVVKLTRNIFMIPAVFILGVWYARQKASAAGRPLTGRDVRKSMPAFLFGFLALAVVRTLVDHLGVFPAALWTTVLAVVAWLAKALVLVAMAGIGLSTRFHAMRTVGASPLMVGFLGAAFLAVVSFLLIRVSGAGL